MPTKAVRIGLASASGPDDELRALAQPLIEQLLAVSPTGLRSKRTLEASLAIDDLDTVIALESGAQQRCQQTGDFDEALRAFIEKRPPNFRPLRR
ncbi:MAG: enoyl-CoA hydratase-related protein [Acidimicrobiales bacterium]